MSNELPFYNVLYDLPEFGRKGTILKTNTDGYNGIAIVLNVHELELQENAHSALVKMLSALGISKEATWFIKPKDASKMVNSLLYKDTAHVLCFSSEQSILPHVDFVQGKWMSIADKKYLFFQDFTNVLANKNQKTLLWNLLKNEFTNG